MRSEEREVPNAVLVLCGEQMKMQLEVICYIFTWNSPASVS